MTCVIKKRTFQGKVSIDAELNYSQFTCFTWFLWSYINSSTMILLSVALDVLFPLAKCDLTPESWGLSNT